MRHSVERAGIDPVPHLAGLSLATATARYGDRVSWDECATFLNRCTDGLDAARREALAETFAEEHPLIWTAAQILSPRNFHRFARTLMRRGYAHIVIDLDDLPDGRLRWVMEIPSSDRACPFFFQWWAVELRNFTRYWRIGRSEVSATLQPRRGEYVVPFPEVESRPPDVQWLARTATGVASGFLRSLFPEERGGSGLVVLLQRRHGLTRAEARVATRLAEGMTLPEIGAVLDIRPETVRTHLKRIYAKTGASRQAELVRLVLTLGGAPRGPRSEEE
jgi:DNA-binding CsgD family transcriptional regulator